MGCLCGLCCVASALAQQRPGTLIGTVTDANVEAPVAWVQIVLDEAGRSTASDETGQFKLVDVPAGTYTLKTSRIGYGALVQRVQILPEDTTVVRLLVSTSPIEAGEVIVEAEQAFRADDLGRAVLTVEDQALRQSLGTTIAETLASQPGVRMRSMGPAPARPVVRGLGGERVLVLEDGERTGDLSATSSDHAVVVEPMTASRIEVVRGPAALLYTSTTQGGVVNVVRGYIPTISYDRPHIEASTQVASVNESVATGVMGVAPFGAWTVRADGSYRSAQDINTPLGRLENTGIETLNGSAGVSYRYRRGYAGVAGSAYTTSYGIPGGFIGAHPTGVRIDVQRRHLEARTEYQPPTPRIPRIEANYSYTFYEHQEIEGNGLTGVEFAAVAYHGKIVARTQRLGPFQQGAFGVWGQYRDYNTGGITFTPATLQRSAAVFGYQEWHRAPWRVQLGGRLDVRQLTPERTFESRIIGLVRERSFSGWSGSVDATWEQDDVDVGVIVTRSLRLPALEELYSGGPHLAAYSFEVGNPDLGKETGLGFEAYAHVHQGRWEGRLSAYLNTFESYLFPRNTGELFVRLLLPLYQIVGEPARMYGAEWSGTWHITPRWELGTQAAYIHGTLTDTDEPLPWIPPLSGHVSLTRRLGALKVGATVRAADSQSRLGPFEETTDSYAVADVFAQFHRTTGRALHTVDLTVQNLTNATYYDHLSRVKSIMPEPGINLRLLYKVYF